MEVWEFCKDMNGESFNNALSFFLKKASDNKCINNPCKNGATCLQAMTSLGYECSCSRGLRGKNCEGKM